MGGWAQTVSNRNQVVLFSPTLDDSIMPDHPVRLFEELLGAMDFGEWESRYVMNDGQPPIHPRLMAGVILYGLSVGIRSSRKLEEATGNRLDFIWLCEGREIDHSTLAKFRVKFEQPLKGLFRQIGKVAIGMGLANLNQIALDGTVKRANNSRYATARRASLGEKLSALDEQIEKMLAEAVQADQKEDELYGQSTPSKLPRELRDMKARQERLRAALKKVESMEQKKNAAEDKGGKAKVPTTDPDSSVIQNKTGGFAPNYTVVLATEGENGFIMDAQLVKGNDESGSVLSAVKHIEESFAQKPDELLADSGFNTGDNLQQLTRQQIEPWMPPRQEPGRENPAIRDDATVPVPTEQHEQLPVSPQQKVLDKSAFVYDPKQDGYLCPMGKVLSFCGTNAYKRDRVSGTYRIYESVAGDCGVCPLAARCVSSKKNKTRRVVRDEYEPLREQMAARMRTESGKQKYKRRSFLCETPFAVMNTTMNVRQMLLRGARKVQMEFNWICSAYNLKKLTKLLAVS